MSINDASLDPGLKIVCDRGRLVEMLSMVSRAVSSRTSVQVLAGILTTAVGDELWFAATDMEVSIASTMPATVSKEGSVVIPGRIFLEACRSLPASEEKVVLEQSAHNKMIELTCGTASYRLNVSTPEDFPRLPEVTESGSFEIDRAAFLETASRVARAASRDESRPVLTGILVKFEDGETADKRKLTMAATDSYRLAVRETVISGNAPSIEAIVPARATAELARIPGEEDALELAIQENHAIFVSGKTTLTTRRIDGQFPNHHQLLPETFAHTIRLPRVEFLEVVRRVAVMAQRTSPIRLRFEEGTLRVSAQTQDVGEASETLPVSFSGEPLEIGFNAEFLREGIDSVIGDEVELNLISPLRPGLLRAEGDSFWYLIMPIRLAG